MSKYSIVNEALEAAVNAGGEQGWNRAEMLLTMIVSAVSEYRGEAGKDAARDALRYEIGELGGEIDTQFIRSR